MKRVVRLFLAFFLCLGSASAQKLGLVDMNYILGKIPAYEKMNHQLEETSKKWQAELSKLEREAQSLYKKYQADLVMLSAEQKSTREEAIIAKEKQAYELKRKYFGPEGELAKRREAMMKPIEDDIWAVLKVIAAKGGYHIIFDRSSGKIVYADPASDVSAQVLEALEARK